MLQNASEFDRHLFHFDWVRVDWLSQLCLQDFRQRTKWLTNPDIGKVEGLTSVRRQFKSSEFYLYDQLDWGVLGRPLAALNCGDLVTKNDELLIPPLRESLDLLLHRLLLEIEDLLEIAVLLDTFFQLVDFGLMQLLALPWAVEGRRHQPKTANLETAASHDVVKGNLRFFLILFVYNNMRASQCLMIERTVVIIHPILVL